MTRDRWYVNRPDHVHPCGYYGWDGPCQELCRADDRYQAEDGRVLFLCDLHRRPRRLGGRVYVDRTEPVTVRWIGEEQ